MNPIKIPAILDGSLRKKDRSYSIRFTTSLEVGKEDRDMIDAMFQTEGWLIFAPNDAKEVEIPKDQAEVGQKPRSQRLRGVLFFLWEKKYKDSYPDFDAFYNSKMDKWIEDIKGLLE